MMQSVRDREQMRGYDNWLEGLPASLSIGLPSLPIEAPNIIGCGGGMDCLYNEAGRESGIHAGEDWVWLDGVAYHEECVTAEDLLQCIKDNCDIRDLKELVQRIGLWRNVGI